MEFPKLRSLQPYTPGIVGCRIHLDANESPFDLPEDLKAKISYEIAQLPFNRYPDALAAEACEAFAALHGLRPELVTAGNGSDELISVLYADFMQRGARVLMTGPDFSMYPLYCSLAECEPITLHKDDALCFTPGALLKLAAETKPDMIIFSNPCNPTGQGLTREQVLEIVRGSGCLVVVDEAYMDFWDQSVLGDVETYENLMVLKTCSKVGLASVRLGFAVACERLTGLLRAVKSPYNVDALTQAAGRVVLGAPDYLSARARKIIALRDTLHAGLAELAEQSTVPLRVFPTHTNFVAVRTPRAAGLHAGLVDRGISVRLISPTLLRITAGTEEENAALLGALRELARL